MDTSTGSTILSMEEMFHTLEAYQVPTELRRITDRHYHSTKKEHENDPVDDPPSNDNDDDDINRARQRMDEYIQVRDTYLQRKLVRNILDHVTTHFDTTTTLPKVSTEEQQTLLQRQQYVFHMITNQASTIQQQRYELRNKYVHFQQKRQEFYHYMKLQQQQQQQENHEKNENNDSSNNAMILPVDENTMEYEHHRMIQEEQIQQLHHRRAQLQVELQTKQQQYQSTIQRIDTSKATIQTLLSVAAEHSHSPKNSPTKEENDLFLDWTQQNWMEDPDEKRLYQLQQHNRQLRTKVENIHDIQQFYYNLRLVLEELHGIRFLRTTTTTRNMYNNNGDDDDDANHTFMVVTVQLLKQYTVDITLDVSSSSSSSSKSNTTNDPAVGCMVQSAILTSDNAMVTGSPIRKSNHNNINDNDDNDTSTTVVQLRIPHFDDIVQYVNTSWTTSMGNGGGGGGGENLRVLIREILARITMVKERVEMFTDLQREPGVVATIGPFCTTNGSVSSTTTTTTTAVTMLHDQEVVCSLNDPPMTMVLRCTGNCPLMDHSIYIDQLHGIGSGWGNIPTLIHDKLQQQPSQHCRSSSKNININSKDSTIQPPQLKNRFRTPLDMIQAVRDEVQVCIQQQQFVVPDTPRLPFRHGSSMWTTVSAPSSQDDNLK